MILVGSQDTARGPADRRSTPRAVEHPLAEARAEQESSALNKRLGELVYQAIIDRIERHGEMHADDLEPYFPAEHVDRCRKLVPGQIGSLRGRKYIQPTKEYRKSTVPARKGAKSWVYVFTRLGREKLTAGVGARGGGASPSIAEVSCVHPGGSSGVHSHAPEPARPPRPLSLLPEPDPETWAA